MYLPSVYMLFWGPPALPSLPTCGRHISIPLKDEVDRDYCTENKVVLVDSESLPFGGSKRVVGKSGNLTWGEDVVRPIRCVSICPVSLGINKDSSHDFHRLSLCMECYV